MSGRPHPHQLLPTPPHGPVTGIALAIFVPFLLVGHACLGGFGCNSKWSVRALTFSAPHFGSRDGGSDQWDPRGKKKKVQALVLAASFFFLLARQRQQNRLSSTLWLLFLLGGPPPQSFPSHPLVETADRPPTCARNNSALPRDVWDEHLQQKQTKPPLLLVALSSAACSMRAGL